MNVAIIGAGLSGIFASEYLSRRGIECTVFEKTDGSFHHQGVLRFKNKMVPQYLNADWEEIEIAKGFLYKGQVYNSATIAMNNLYSRKTTGEYHKRSVMSDSTDTKRYILTSEPRLGENCRYNCKISGIEKGRLFLDSDMGKIPSSPFDFIVSTVPIYSAAELCGIPVFEEFKLKTIHSAIANLDVPSTIFQTLYVIDPEISIYRVTIHRRQIIVESVSPVDYDECDKVLKHFGINMSLKFQFAAWTGGVGKIVPINDIERRKLILKMTQKFNVFSFGRYAVWKPRLVLDNMLGDIERIHKMMRMMEGERQYESQLG